MNNTIDRKDSKSESPLTQVSVPQQQLLVKKYLQNPFSISRSQLAVLMG
jgi:hypothetical protein